jgi:Terpene synthase family 2, C-terminal metal binding
VASADNILANIAPNQLPDWRKLAQAQLDVPGTREFIATLAEELRQSPLQDFGPSVMGRLQDYVFFAATTFSQALRQYFSRENAQFITWVFAVDDLLDTCPNFDYARDFQLLLNRRLELSINDDMYWSDLNLIMDPATRLPNLSYSLLSLVENIQPLRHSLMAKAQDTNGIAIFDRYLADQIIPTMLSETRWRLRLEPTPNFNQYMERAHISICAGLGVSTVNAVLAHPYENWMDIEPATYIVCNATRLINDIATWPKDKIEGKPNALGLLANEHGEQEAKRRIEAIVDAYLVAAECLCRPHLEVANAEEPLYILNYYIYHVLVMTRAMYSRGDFIEP